MTIPVPTFAVAKGLVSIPHGFAVIVTLFRLYDRWRTGRLWWDDYWALISLMWDIPNWLAFLLRPPNGSGEKYFTYRSRVIIFWFTLICFPLTLWSARISIGASLVRVLPPGATMRKIAFYMNVAFGCMCASVVIQRTISCTRYSTWHTTSTVQCTFPTTSGVINLATDIAGDIMLITVPLIALWNVKMPRNLRRIVLSIFAASIVTTLSSVAYAAFLFISRHQWRIRLYVVITSHVESAVSLIVCNLLVLVTYFYRAYRGGEDIESYYPSSIASSQPPSYELPSQIITGVPRRNTSTTDQEQTVTASIALTEIFAEQSSDFEYYASSSSSSSSSPSSTSTSSNRVGEKSRN